MTEPLSPDTLANGTDDLPNIDLTDLVDLFNRPATTFFGSYLKLTDESSPEEKESAISKLFSKINIWTAFGSVVSKKVAAFTEAASVDDAGAEKKQGGTKQKTISRYWRSLADDVRETLSGRFKGEADINNDRLALLADANIKYPDICKKIQDEREEKAAKAAAKAAKAAAEDAGSGEGKGKGKGNARKSTVTGGGKGSSSGKKVDPEKLKNDVSQILSEHVRLLRKQLQAKFDQDQIADAFDSIDTWKQNVTNAVMAVDVCE